MLEAVTSFLLIFTAVRRDCHPADNPWAKTFHHIFHWRGGLHLFQLLQQRTHGWVHHKASSTFRAASASDPHRDLQERLFPVECTSVTQWHCHQVGAARTVWPGIAWLRALDSCGSRLPSVACWWWHSLWPEHHLGSVYIQWLLFSWAGHWGGWRWKGWAVVSGGDCLTAVVLYSNSCELSWQWRESCNLELLRQKSWLAEVSRKVTGINSFVVGLTTTIALSVRTKISKRKIEITSIFFSGSQTAIRTKCGIGFYVI